MPTLKDGYRTADGERVPSVTTILGRFKLARPLMIWAWNCGKEGKDINEIADKAASAGTLAHTWIDDTIHGRPLSDTDLPEDQQALARNAYEQFLSWRQRYSLVVHRTELPLVSERYRFGGTMDAVTVDGQPAILDWKTSAAIYSDYLLQCAAYALLWEETQGQPIDSAHILRVSKDHADFEHRSFTGLKEAKEQFLLYVQAYELDKALNKRVR